MAEPGANLPDETGDRILAAALAVTAGFADAFGFLELHGLLTAHITGNLAFMAVGLARGSPHVIMQFLAVPLFMAGVSAATLVITWLDLNSRLSLVWSLLLEAALFLICLLAGTALPPCRFTDDLTGCCVGTLLIMTMATQNAIMRLPLKTLPSTTAMTSNITEATVQWTRGLAGLGRTLPAAERGKVFGRARTVGLTVGAFATGGISGALAARWLGYPGLIAPICILALLALRILIIRGTDAPDAEARL